MYRPVITDLTINDKNITIGYRNTKSLTTNAIFGDACLAYLYDDTKVFSSNNFIFSIEKSLYLLQIIRAMLILVRAVLVANHHSFVTIF